MAKVRTFKQLKNHPLVERVWTEYQPGVFDNTDYTYWVELIDGYQFEVVETIAMSEPTKGKLINAFNDYPPKKF